MGQEDEKDLKRARVVLSQGGRARLLHDVKCYCNEEGQGQALG
jgi:hypothetical protein